MSEPHGLESYRVHPLDSQTTIYICRCGQRTTNRARLDRHVHKETQR